MKEKGAFIQVKYGTSQDQSGITEGGHVHFWQLAET